MAYSISLAKHGSLSASRRWSLSIEYGGISRRKAVDSGGNSSIVLKKKDIEKHLLLQFVNTIQSNLSTECIQNQFLFLKDCTSKHVGPILSFMYRLLGHPITLNYT